MSSKDKILTGLNNPKGAVGYLSDSAGELIETQMLKTQVGLGNHLKGRKNIRNAKANCNLTLLTEHREDVETLESQGVVGLGQPYDDSVIVTIQTKVDELIKNKKNHTHVHLTRVMSTVKQFSKFTNGFRNWLSCLLTISLHD